jgi:cyclase
VGEEGALLVDTGRAGTSEAVLQAIRQVTTLPVRYVINTSPGPNQIGNNPEFATLPGGSTDRRGRGPAVAIIANEAVLLRMSAPDTKSPAAGWPTDAYAAKERNIRFNHEAIDIIHIPGAYTAGDSLVYFRRSDVIVAGEIYSTKRFPLVDRAHGGTVTGVLAGLNRILDIAVPEVVADNFAEGGTFVIPGSGRLSDEDDVTEYRDMVAITRDRVASLVGMKRTLDQVKAANLLVDYDARYSTPSWTGAMYIDALYAELSAGKRGDAGGGPR